MYTYKPIQLGNRVRKSNKADSITSDGISFKHNGIDVKDIKNL